MVVIKEEANRMEPTEQASKIDSFFQPGAHWAEPLSLLRELLLFAGLSEELKWGKPTYLRNGVKLSGKILSQDAAAIVVDGKNGTENLVFMHAISTVAIPTGTKADG